MKKQFMKLLTSSVDEKRPVNFFNQNKDTHLYWSFLKISIIQVFFQINSIYLKGKTKSQSQSEGGMGDGWLHDR